MREGTFDAHCATAEERVLGARNMMNDNLWDRFGKPDYALAFHVSSMLPSGIVNVVDGSPMPEQTQLIYTFMASVRMGLHLMQAKIRLTWQSNRKLIADPCIERATAETTWRGYRWRIS